MTLAPSSPTPFADLIAELEQQPSGAAFFPCVPGGKEPACPGGHRSATSDLARLRAWANENPAYNVGLDPHSIGLCVIDVDGRPGEDALTDLQITHGELPITLAHGTPGGGRHLIFRGVLPATASKLAPHVDTRGAGAGYIIVPPSVTAAGAYTVLDDCEPADLPEWVATLAHRKRDAAAAVVGVDLDQTANVARAAAFLRTAAPAVEGQGGDARTYALACEVLNLGVSPEMALSLMEKHWNPRCEPPWDREDLELKITNAAAYAQNEPGAWAVEPAALVFAEALGKLVLDDPQPARTIPDVTAYPTPKSAAELAAGTFPRAEYALEKFVLQNHVNLLYGDGGAGKTLLATTWAVTVAAGRPWCDLAVKQMPALIVLAEDDDGETKARLEAICATLGCDLADLPITVWCLPGCDTNIALIRDDGTWEPGPFLSPLKAELAKIGPCLLILDTVSDIAALDETKRLPVNALCKAVLTGLCREFDATILVNAHPSKAAMNDGSGYAGSTAWNNAVRNRLTLERVEAASPRRILKVAKANYGQETELELFQVGLTFVTGKETAAEDRRALLRDACVRVALMAAECGAPIQRQRRLNKWQMDEIASVAGYRPSDHDAKEELASALYAGRLRYIPGSNLTTAGYYPADQQRADELARQARKGIGGANA